MNGQLGAAGASTKGIIAIPVRDVMSEIEAMTVSRSTDSLTSAFQPAWSTAANNGSSKIETVMPGTSSEHAVV